MVNKKVLGYPIDKPLIFIFVVIQIASIVILDHNWVK